MGATGILVAVETALLALALLFVVALLRSHAEILRRLASLEATGGSEASSAALTGDVAGGDDDEVPLSVLSGETPDGDAVQVSLVGGRSRTLLSFLSSGCSACGPLWEGLRGDGAGAGPDTRIVVVTHGSERESPARLRELRPAPGGGVDVVMSSGAYSAFAVPVTPHFVLLSGDGRVLGRGSAGSWPQILRLLADSDADGAAPARTSSARAERAEQALAAAGVGRGHPSLYPSRGGQP